MRRPSLQVALAVLLVLAGCSMFGSEPVRESDAVDRLDAAGERVDAVSSYRYNVTIDASTTAGDERVTGHGVGAVNATSQRQVANMSFDGERSVNYLDNRTGFTECRGPLGDGLWGRQQRSTESEWVALTPVGRQLDLLSTGDLYYNGTETVGGRDVTHISGEPSDEVLSERGVGSRNAPVFGSSNVDSVTVDLWLDTATDRPVRSAIRVVVSADGETATATLTFRYRDYGDRVRVSVPDSVREDALSTGCPGS
ncbi:hypothetical protein [Haloarcula laminariae]|uniref:hypothetical protein n=1 Tax=Haloarcula laminariae TaxID=2961577 RepID=UPI0021C97A56|nr:hypothetical protein [Halomicroarcula laminariae]